MSDQTPKYSCPECGAPTKEMHFPKLAGGTGFIAFRRVSRKKHSLQLLLSKRTDLANVGYAVPTSGRFGITGGGFVDCDEVLKLEVGDYEETLFHAYREGHEENKGFESIITERDFFERSQPLPPINVRTSDINRGHICMYNALEVISTDEWDQLRRTPPSSERDGYLQRVSLSWRVDIERQDPQRFISLIDQETGFDIEMGDFFHQHELYALGMMAYWEHTGRLW